MKPNVMTADPGRWPNFHNCINTYYVSLLTCGSVLIREAQCFNWTLELILPAEEKQ